MTEDNALHRYFLNNNSKLMNKWFHYFDIYERHFNRFRNRPISMLEIGVSKGGSLQMWKSYFHEDSQIIGIDINPQCMEHEEDNVKVRIGSQIDRQFLKDIVDEFGPFDIVLDDGSHKNDHVITTFEVLFPHTKESGVYLIEDMHTSYWRRFGGALRSGNTMIEYFKQKIDELNAIHVRGDFQSTDFTKSVDCMAFYDSVLVIEKRRQGLRQDAKTLGMR